MSLEVIEFINRNKDWKSILSIAPYNISIKTDGDYTILKYNQLSSDFSLPIVRECRGLIIRQEKEEWVPVCIPFFKFGNYGESYVPDIDWDSARVLSKIDGSLMKLWYDRGKWRLSTNGTIDAFKAVINDTGKSFGELFIHTLKLGFNKLVLSLDKSCTYMFELVSPENKVVIPYDISALYFIGIRSNISPYQEFKPEDYASNIPEIAQRGNLFLPKLYHLRTLDDCIKVASEMNWKHEGFVVCDKDFNRIKIKSPAYLIAHKNANNGQVTNRKIFEMIRNESIDDFLAYYPEYQEKTKNLVAAYAKLINMIDSFWKDEYAEYERKDLAKTIAHNPYKTFIFRKYDNNSLSAAEWMNNLDVSKVLTLIEGLE